MQPLPLTAHPGTPSCGSQTFNEGSSSYISRSRGLFCAATALRAGDVFLFVPD